jgi:3-mercaptopyruvate sulfurtransferase SseA
MRHSPLIASRTVPLCLASALALAAWGCGGSAGTSSYSSPITTTQTASAIIDAATLAKWTDEGKVNAPFGTADRVVVVSATTPANFISRKHIPDAFLLDSGTELGMVREEGLGPTGTMVIAGPQMDALVQKLGIDGATTVVLTIPRGSTDSEHLQASVAYWTFRYWGFSRERVRILNGGDDAWEVAGRPLTDAALVPTPSTFSVTANKVLKDTMRYSVGEMLTLVDSINRDPSVRDTVQMLDVRGLTISPYIANAYRGNGPMQFVLDRVNGESTRNRLYPDQATAISRLSTIPVVDGATNVYLSPSKKLISMCGTSFNCSPIFVVFDAVLQVPEGNAAMYDGSSTQWNNYSVAKIKAAGASAAQANTWAFDAPTAGTEKLRAVGALPAAVAGENTFIPGLFVYLPSQDQVNQIESADKAYMAKTSGGTTPGGGGGTTGGGC